MPAPSQASADDVAIEQFEYLLSVTGDNTATEAEISRWNRVVAILMEPLTTQVFANRKSDLKIASPAVGHNR